MRIIDASKRYSAAVDTSPEDLAAQLTLIDLPIFKAIKRHELVRLGDPGSAATAPAPASERAACPNVAAMKRQFNQVAFWVVGQILAHDSARQRAELVSHFIRTARRLFQLNNLHSSNALVSALASSPIYRLERTWQLVRKRHAKDKQHYDWLLALYSDTNNYEALRRHLDSCQLPCIPYLGLYSRDLIYINEAHPEGSARRARATGRILESIERFQASEFAELVHAPDVAGCLLANRYLDELQKFVEEENYRRSVQLEPGPAAGQRRPVGGARGAAEPLSAI